MLYPSQLSPLLGARKFLQGKGRAMCNLIGRFWRDESGSVMVGDWVFVATILVLGAVTGMVALHQPTPDEPDDAPRAAVVHPSPNNAR
jgi:Flp pilus assembly pilin Flp